MIPTRRRSDVRGRPEARAGPALSGWRPSTSLTGSIAADHPRLVDVRRAAAAGRGGRRSRRRRSAARPARAAPPRVVSAGEPDVRARRCRPRRGLVLERGCRCRRRDRRRRGPSRGRRSPSSRTSSATSPRIARGERLAVHERRRHTRLGHLHVADVEAERWASFTPSSRSSRRRSTSRSYMSRADHRARLRPPHRVLDEDRQQLVRRIDELSAASSCPRPRAGRARRPCPRRGGCRRRSRAGCRAPRAPCPASRARDQPEARDDQALVEDLHLEDLLLERVGLEGHVRELVEVRVALGGAAGLGDQLEPRLGVARLVLHHRRVVELRLGVGRDVQELGGHLAGEHVRLELLGEDRAPHVAAGAPCAAASPSPPGSAGWSPQGRSRTCHSCFLASS